MFDNAELAKVVLVFYLAYFYSSKQALVKSFSVGFIPPVVVTLILAGPWMITLMTDYMRRLYESIPGVIG